MGVSLCEVERYRFVDVCERWREFVCVYVCVSFSSQVQVLWWQSSLSDAMFGSHLEGLDTAGVGGDSVSTSGAHVMEVWSVGVCLEDPLCL